MIQVVDFPGVADQGVAPGVVLVVGLPVLYFSWFGLLAPLMFSALTKQRENPFVNEKR